MPSFSGVEVFKLITRDVLESILNTRNRGEFLRILADFTLKRSSIYWLPTIHDFQSKARRKPLIGR
jgi:hypothetical protein